MNDRKISKIINNFIDECRRPKYNKKQYLLIEEIDDEEQKKYVNKFEVIDIVVTKKKNEEYSEIKGRIVFKKEWVESL